LAATLPSSKLPAYRAASSDDKNAALLDASWRLDNAYAYQGRKYGPDVLTAQTLEFPRIARGDIWRGRPLPQWRSFGTDVWDIDTDGNVVVPHNVLLAVLYEADSLLD